MSILLTAIAGQHEVIVTGGGPDSVTLEKFNWVNTMIGNVKNSIHESSITSSASLDKRFNSRS